MKDQNGATIAGAAVTWSSSRAAVASVSTSGLVESVTNGTAEITATSGTLSASAAASVIQIAASTVLPGEWVSFAFLGDTLTATASVLDRLGHVIEGATVMWSTSPESVATVTSGGLITAAANGLALVTAEAGNASTSALVFVFELSSSLRDDQFALISSGTFQMGSSTGDSDEQPVHTVNITRPFYIQRSEVTQAQWLGVMGENPSSFVSCGGDCPVASVSWDDIQIFLDRLNTQDPGKNYRLPTEAEWEYSARAETTGDYGGNGVLDDMGWYAANSVFSTYPVALKRPNAWALYDMHGNAMEIVEDWYSANYYVSSPSSDPTGPTAGEQRVLRGGDFYSSPSMATSSWRWSAPPSVGLFYFGFRLARTP